MLDFYATRGGRQLIDGTMPRIAAALERIAAALEKQNEPKPWGSPDAPTVPPDREV